MADITVMPQEWHYVEYDSDRIASLAGTLVDQIGIDVPLRVEVDESSPLGTAQVASLDPLVIRAESGAFEDPKRPRQLSDRSVTDVLGRLLFRVQDRFDGGFGDPPADDELNLAQSTAWDAYAVGRLSRLGYAAQRQRRLYHFRNRHGFSDTADAAFARLWDGDSLAWSDIVAVCDETAATRTVA